MPKKSEQEEEEGFEKFIDLSAALEKQNAIMQDEAMKYLHNRTCPFMKEKCKQMECAWYIICLNKNMHAFKEFFQ